MGGVGTCPAWACPHPTLQDQGLTQLQDNDGGVSAQGVGGHALGTCLQQLWGHKDIQDAQDTLRILVLFAGLQGRRRSSGVGRTLGRGSRARAGMDESLGAAMCLLTVPSTLQTTLGRGCPEASQDRFSTEFSFTHIFLSLSAIHGDPEPGRGRVRQQTLPACHPPPHQSPPGQRVAFGPQRA